MPASRRNINRRSKHHVPRKVLIPIMGDLQRAFAFDAHGALAALRLAPNEAAFDQLAGIFNVIAVGLADIGERSFILESGIRALQDVGDRFTRTGGLGIARHEQQPIQNAAMECEELLNKLDVIGLHLSGRKLTAIAAAQRAAKGARA